MTHQCKGQAGSVPEPVGVSWEAVGGAVSMSALVSECYWPHDDQGERLSTQARFVKDIGTV